MLGAGCTSDPGTTAASAASDQPAASSPAAPPAGASGTAAPTGVTALAAATGFRVSLDQREGPAPGPNGAGKVSWESTWRLTWTPVPGATSYAIFYGTNEGTGEQPRDMQDSTALIVQAAAGTSPRSRLQQDREAGLLFTASQLLVAVRPQGAAGPGPRSLWFPVGEVPANGQPRGTAEIGDH